MHRPVWPGQVRIASTSGASSSHAVPDIGGQYCGTPLDWTICMQHTRAMASEAAADSASRRVLLPNAGAEPVKAVSYRLQPHHEPPSSALVQPQQAACFCSESGMCLLGHPLDPPGDIGILQDQACTCSKDMLWGPHQQAESNAGLRQVLMKWRSSHCIR